MNSTVILNLGQTELGAKDTCFQVVNLTSSERPSERNK